MPVYELWYNEQVATLHCPTPFIAFFYIHGSICIQRASIIWIKVDTYEMHQYLVRQPLTSGMARYAKFSMFRQQERSFDLFATHTSYERGWHDQTLLTTMMYQ